MSYWNIAMSLLVGLFLLVNQALAADSWQCKTKPIEPCFKRQGRLSSQNGITPTIWLIGTKRIVRVDETDVPAFLYKYMDLTLPNHSYIYGDFTVCPLAPDQPGHMRWICVAAAEKLVVQNIADTRRTFRLLYTWPVGER